MTENLPEKIESLKQLELKNLLDKLKVGKSLTKTEQQRAEELKEHFTNKEIIEAPKPKEIVIHDRMPQFKFIAARILDGDDIETIVKKFNDKYEIQIDANTLLVDYLIKIPFNILKELEVPLSFIPIADVSYRMLQWQIMFVRYKQINNDIGMGRTLQAAKLEMESLQGLDDNKEPLENKEMEELEAGMSVAMDMYKEIIEESKKEKK